MVTMHTDDAVLDVAHEVMCEIEWDIAEGLVPSTVSSFSDLRDHVDANEYGGLHELPVQDERESFINAVQSEVSRRLARGEHRRWSVAYIEIHAEWTFLNREANESYVVPVFGVPVDEEEGGLDIGSPILEAQIERFLDEQGIGRDARSWNVA